MKHILLLGSQHGNELLGDTLFHYIKHTRPELLPCITFKIGNLRAKKQNVRYIESDLNRSYNGKKGTYEERRAKRLLRFITHADFDLVLDLHTTTCQQPPCLIIPSVNPAITPFLRACHITTIVHMDHPIVQTSLIGRYRKAISIEVNKHQVNTPLMEELCASLQRYINGQTGYQHKTMYNVTELLLKTELSEAQASTLRNFRKSRFGFYPVLVGENSYKKQTNYLGFKAYTAKKSEV